MSQARSYPIALGALGVACSLLAPTDGDLRGGTHGAAGLPGAGESGFASGGGGTGTAGSGNGASAGDGRGGQGAGAETMGGAGARGGETGGEAASTGADSGAGGESGSGVEPSVSKAGLLLWLMADRGVTEQNGAVAAWADQSDRAFDAMQNVEALRPRRVAPNAARPPMLEFDGTNDVLELPEGFASFGGVSFFAVVEVLAARKCVSFLQLSNGEDVDDIDFGRQLDSVHYEVGDPWIDGPTGVFALNQTLLVSSLHSAAGVASIYLNGSFLESAPLELPASVARTLNFIGRSLYVPFGCTALHGRIGEILLYDRALQSAEARAVYDYLRSKWSCCG